MSDRKYEVIRSEGGPSLYRNGERTGRASNAEVAFHDELAEVRGRNAELEAENERLRGVLKEIHEEAASNDRINDYYWYEDIAAAALKKSEL